MTFSSSPKMLRKLVMSLALLHFLLCISSAYNLDAGSKPRQSPSLIPQKQPSIIVSRRDCWTAAVASAALMMVVPVHPAMAATTTTTTTTTTSTTTDAATTTTIIAPLRLAMKTLQQLLDNWDDSVVDCNYADVPRELLETKNKEQLLEKASTFALFDKSVSVVTCKTNNKKIRDYLGRTGIGPLVGLEKLLRKALELVDDPDDLDAFVQASEAAQQALSRADSYSYTAGGDYDALNNFAKENQHKILDANGNLKQVRQSIETAVVNLSTILSIIDKK